MGSDDFLEVLRNSHRERVLASEKHRQASDQFLTKLQSMKLQIFEVTGNGFSRPRTLDSEQHPMAVVGESKDTMLILDASEERGTQIFTALSLTDWGLWYFSLPNISELVPKPSLAEDIKGLALGVVKQTVAN